MALQEYLASYAVKVDEDGARRLQAILDQNRDTASDLAAAFSSAYQALKVLKTELSDASGLKNILSSISSLTQATSGLSLSSLSGESAPSASVASGAASVSVSADTSSAEESLESYRAKAEALRPKLNVNTSGITSAVASAVSAVRAMMSSVSITIPVKAKATLDTSGLTGASSSGSTSGSTSGSSGSGNTIARFGSGGRVERPTLAMLAEEGEPEYIIPVKDESRALPLLRSLMGELSESARNQMTLVSAGPSSVSHSVQVPVSISVTSSAASPEAVGQYIYDTTRRSLLKTLEGVFT